MIKKLAPKMQQIASPVKVNGGCVPYAVAAITGREEVIHQYPSKDEKGDPVSHDFYHASMMISQVWGEFMYFNVILATSRTYNKNGRLSCPKETIRFRQFSHSGMIYALSKNHNKDVSNCVLLFEVHTAKSVHCIGAILDLHNGKVIIADREKPTLIKMNIEDVFDHFRVLKVAILKYSDRIVPLYPDTHFGHIIKQEDGTRSDG